MFLNATSTITTKSVLLVDDEDCVRNLVKTILEEIGYDVYSARSAEIALRIWDDRKQEIELVITDVSLPGMSGTEMVQKMKEGGAKVKCMFITGNGENLDPGIYRDCVGSLLKPFGVTELVKKMGQVA